MKKRLPTSIAILIVTIGFVLLRQFSLLFFDGFATIIMLGSVIEIIRVHKKEQKPIDIPVLVISPILIALIYIFARHYKE